jgi:hypothetical protein
MEDMEGISSMMAIKRKTDINHRLVFLVFIMTESLGT